MKQLTKDTLENLLVNLKVAAKDRVDLIMFSLIAILAFLSITNLFYSRATIGFIAFYVFFLLIRNAAFKRQIEELKK